MRVSILPPHATGVRWDALDEGDWFRVVGESVVRMKLNSDTMLCYRDYGVDTPTIKYFNDFYDRGSTNLVRLIPCSFEFRDQDITK